MKGSLKYNFIYRYTVIVWMVIKFIFKIYFFLFRHSVWDSKTQKKWNDLLVNMAKEYRIKAVSLGGVLVKVGQFLTTRTDIMPDVFIKELSGLVDQVKPMSFDYAKSLMEEEWGAAIDEHLLEINESSIASASIGEVYQGKLKDGTPVAVKVQRYRIQEIFRKDFIALRMVFWIIAKFTSFGKNADMKALFHEIVRVMDRELDFEQELEFGKYFRERYQDDDYVHIPAFHEDLTTTKVLVMEWMDGAKITDLEYIKEHDINVEETTKTLFDFYIDQFLNPGNFHADPHSGNILVQQDGTIAIIDFGMVGELSKQDTHNFKMFVQGFIIDDYDIIIDALEEMNFLLPDADRKQLKKNLKQAVEMYESGSFKDLDADAMAKIKNEVRHFVKEEPIQLPADYAYYGRAVSIVVGILFTVYPDMDIEEWAKPKIKQWFGTRNILESIYKQKAKDLAKPILSMPNALLSFLESGEKDRQWDKEKHHTQLKHHFYLLLEVISFIMIVVGIGLAVYASIFNSMTISIIAIVLIALFTTTTSILLFKHFRMIRSRK
ncbi:ABC1 kinase family protein [Virgibacillus salidurans]|uniref:ABC1 kinase family protein n=1 Tax=Virgibacillus salidurans TaxID=2831673 RepID=UPI001F2AEA5E|nr:AarF/UbiB family protein [Virgibacillus sp. NKC19-16]